MSKTLTETFQALVNEPVNLSTKDVSGSYMKVAPQIDIDDYLGWANDNSHKADYFHIILSVKVDQNSGFIPFYSILKGKSTTDSLLRGEILELGKNNITNNYSDFLSNFTFERKAILRDVPRISFTYGVDDVVTNIHIGQEEFAEGKTWLQEQPTDLTEENPGIIGGAFPQIREELSKDGSFAKVLSGFYRKSIDTGSRKELFFTSFNMDTDYQGAGFLTRLMVISTGKGEIDEFTAARLNKIREIVSYIRTRYVRDLWMKNNYEATKSAKAAIMSRNMSHNLGSHVMSYLKQQLGSITAITNDQSKVLSNLFPWPEDMSPETKKYMENKLNQTELPFLVGLGRFIGYLQERQDYIATIATDYIPYGAPVNLKDAIYDELNPDLRYMRHKDQSRNRPTNILLNYIAKSELLSRENAKKDEDGKIRLDESGKKVLDKDGKEIKDLKIDSERDIRFGFIHYYSDTEFKTFGFETFHSEDPVLSEMRTVNFNIPGGLVGRQAIFSIFENLIRNAAKHGDMRNAKNLDFTLDVIDGAKVKKHSCAAWKQRVGDVKWRTLYENAIDIEDLFILTITDNLPNKSEVVQHLCEGLREEYIDEKTGQMTPANKGIKEIRISAAWLRGDVDESKYLRYDDDPTTINKLAPIAAVELSPEGHLRYIICVHKSKTVAIVEQVGNDKIDEEQMKVFRSLHVDDSDRWNILTQEELEHSKTSYTFILCPDTEAAFKTLRPHTSNRLLRWPTPIAHHSITNNSDETLSLIYRRFTGLNQKSKNIYIDDYTDLRFTNEDKIYYKIKLTKETKCPKGAYLYKTHLGTRNNYEEFVKTDRKYDSYACAEGITGDNSSDRLIRREPLDERWYYTHLYALKQRIAIIDERIFKMVHDVDEEKLKSPVTQISIAEHLVSYVKANKQRLKAVKRILLDNVSMTPRQKIKLRESSSIEDIQKIDFKEKSFPSSWFEELPGWKVEVIGSSHFTPYYRKKGIDVFSVIKNSQGEMMLVGCVETSCTKKPTVTFKNVFDDIATIKYDETTGVVTFCYVNDMVKAAFEQKYNYVSIHQGILDKIYDRFNFKMQGDTMTKEEKKVWMAKKKGKVTESLYMNLVQTPSKIDDYLPNFIIHSGRAKPSEEDMPQHQPFIQYAAIENAVKDCKPMLVDLLDYAKYEN